MPGSPPFAQPPRAPARRSAVTAYLPFEFEGRPAPEPARLGLALADDADRARLVRAAVVHAPFAAAVLDACRALLTAETPRDRAAAVHVAHALGARPLVDPVCAALAEAPDGFVGVPDPLGPDGATLALTALRFLIEVALPDHPGTRRALRDAMAIDELRVEAWHALGARDPEAVLPHLGALLTQAPRLAGAVATRFALVHTPHVEAAARAVAPLPEETRRAFAADLEKHLRRIFAIRRWVTCRRILFGR